MKTFYKFCLYTLICISIISCGEKKFLPSTDEKAELLGWAGWVQLPDDTGSLVMSDYFPNYEKIDSIGVNEDLNLELSSDKKILKYKIKPIMPFLSEIRVYFKTTPYSIIVKKTAKINHTIQFDPKGAIYQTVELNSEINNWNASKLPMKLENDIWQISLKLDQGQYQYVFKVDGTNILDPANNDSVANGIGGFNSLLRISLAKEDELPYFYTASFNEKEIEVGFLNETDRMYVIWENYVLPEGFLKSKPGNIQT